MIISLFFCCVIGISFAIGQPLVYEQKKIMASDGMPGEKFGASVSLSENTMVVGAPLKGKNANDVGYGGAYIFERDFGGSENWGEVATLIAPDGANFDQFGRSVSMCGNTLVVGAPGNVNSGTRTGSVYIFERQNPSTESWELTIKITSSDGVDGDLFGYALSIDGHTLVVGAIGNDAFGDSAGSAYIFERNYGGEGNWGEVKKIIGSNSTNGSSFGVSTSISGDTLVVGANDEFGLGTRNGVAYVFERNEGGANNWGQVSRLLDSTPSTLDGGEFGKSVSISGDMVVVSNPTEHFGNEGSGSVFIFERDQGGINNWGQIRKLTPVNGLVNTYGNFGASVALDGDALVASDFVHAKVPIFERHFGGADNWGTHAHFIASDSEPINYGQFGISLAISGNTVAVGARHDNDNGENSGSVYLFEALNGRVLNADFLVNDTAGTVPLTVQFTDSSTATNTTITSWQWDFDGDGITDSVDQHPVWTYTQPGQYTVSLTVSDSMESDTETKTEFILVTAPPRHHSTWPFDENTGCIAFDATGANDGTLLPACSENSPTWVPGASNAALRFDGYDDRVVVPADPSLQPDQLTVAAWVYPENTGTWDTVLMHSSTSRWSDGYGIYYRSNAGINFYINHYNIRVVAPIPSGQWTHVAGTYDGSAIRLYLNGEQVAFRDYALPINYPSATAPLLIGKGTGGSVAYAWNGMIDEVHLVGEAMSTSEIQALCELGPQDPASLNADFTPDTTSGDTPLRVQFTDTSTATNTAITSWQWDFDDDGIIDATGRDPMFIYETPGTYTVTLTISDGSLSDVATKIDLVTASTPPATTVTETLKFAPSDGAELDRMGYAVAVSGDTAVIGAYQDDDYGYNSGSAYILERDPSDPNSWLFVKKLFASDASATDHFGFSVAIDGDTLLIGAYLSDGGEPDTGAAYVFERNHGGLNHWGEVAKLSASDAGGGNHLAFSVALQGNTAVLGAPMAEGTGSAYVFERHFGGTEAWGEVLKVTSPESNLDDRFGSSVAIDVNTLVVGAYNGDGSEVDAGSAYVFKRDQGNPLQWHEIKELIASDGLVTDRFGWSVTIRKDTIAIGADRHDVAGGINAGAVYLFERDHGGLETWGQVRKLFLLSPGNNDRFGHSISLNEASETLVVATPWSNEVLATSGSVSVFQRHFGGTQAWGKALVLTASEGASQDWFGYSVSMSGSSVLVGAPYDDDHGRDSGACYFFEL
ncbi:LamG-like jellyroll fold domain-containing protein [Acanthopleuribacter pedis]|uniref:PKD domain-containing protein n=1 Tax=Acanthopleuribacter pedis TaxID=442870 RepID=A0A8J7QH73_9BACT|nr:LamG-like jellyroll fold domain-containing protein [Acanthopleuribacter pedis]MBO1320336.1 PKD domain-containing protein [Acanthopleuribacter pedis]